MSMRNKKLVSVEQCLFCEEPMTSADANNWRVLVAKFDWVSGARFENPRQVSGHQICPQKPVLCSRNCGEHVDRSQGPVNSRAVIRYDIETGKVVHLTIPTSHMDGACRTRFQRKASAYVGGVNKFPAREHAYMSVGTSLS